METMMNYHRPCSGQWSQPIFRMTTPDDSVQQEVRRAKDSLLRLETKIRPGAWNDDTTFETSKTEQITCEIKRYSLDILTIFECRWTGSGPKMAQLFCTLGTTINKCSHALIVSKEKVNTYQSLLQTPEHCELTIIECIQCYATTNEVEEKEKDDWYERLQQAGAVVEDLADKDEHAAARGEMSTVYKITK